jgi:hypothetical protein
MRAQWRIALATTVLALATPYAAGLAALGYGFNERERHGALYQWLYAGPLSLPPVVADQYAFWLPASIAIYAVQYACLFILIRYGIVLLQRTANALRPTWSQGARELIVWGLSGVALAIGFSLLGMAVWFAPLPATILLLVCYPSRNERSVSAYAQHGT